MNVLSLFDGISCGMVALERAGARVDKYYSSEIEPTAIEISRSNYPNIVRLGDVTKWREWDIDWSEIDLLIGGSPCQGFSFCGKQLNFEDPRSKLFFVFVEILEHIRKYNNSVVFLLENVQMKKEYQDVISNLLCVQPVKINSNVIVPMRRNRLYWFNFDEPVFHNRESVLLDFLDDNDYVDEGFFLSQKQLEKNTSTINGINYMKTCGEKMQEIHVGDGCSMSRTWQQYAPVIRNESHCIRAANPDDIGVCISVEPTLKIRRFTLGEMERMQTLPIGYTDCTGVSTRKAKQAIGNGWTVDVVAQILKNCWFCK